ncbi:inorganic phosphate transporter [Falsarthrobacter nasiphocae]|uniref:PiT family inorganic phosphate transporter n=1 Tax=Falsarthrobacter nasiphocae TaxID=189863 RepID=A0AAE3YGQ3_9MICC|nr:inorganic phosphate transporter [Falsarthrobacter nasiphocae]MDR6891942.1 PiT family inorganic phosphate transporter [Falsarthrobacter nasiphocae]
MDAALLLAALVASAGFVLINGMLDAPHAFAPPVRTRALTPRAAVTLSAALTAAGVLMATGLMPAVLVSFEVPPGRSGLVLILAAALGAAAWGAVAHWRRMPSSSTHALLSSVLGASLAAGVIGHPTLWAKPGLLLVSIIVPLLVGPWLGFALAWLVANAVTFVRRGAAAGTVNRNSRLNQSVMSGLFAMAHGLQDGQRAYLLFTGAFIASGAAITPAGHWALTLTAAALLGGGASLGSWRVARTLTHRMTRLDPASGSVGSATAAALLAAGMMVNLPLSSAQVSTASLLGAAEATPFHHTSWRTVLTILLFWLITPVGAAFLGGFFYLTASALVF